MVDSPQDARVAEAFGHPAAVEVLELSTNDLLTNVRDEADAYESGRRVVDRLVDNGVKQLEKALDQRNWDDGDTLDRRPEILPRPTKSWMPVAKSQHPPLV